MEAAGRKATAKFHADRGDYAIDDAAFLQALSRPGEHALVFTVVAGEDSDLLDGTLAVSEGRASPGAAPSDAQGGPSRPLSPAIAALAGLGLLGAGTLYWRQRRAARGKDLEVTR